jgi:hypothetical protein
VRRQVVGLGQALYVGGDPFTEVRPDLHGQGSPLRAHVRGWHRAVAVPSRSAVSGSRSCGRGGSPAGSAR